MSQIFASVKFKITLEQRIKWKNFSAENYMDSCLKYVFSNEAQLFF